MMIRSMAGAATVAAATLLAAVALDNPWAQARTRVDCEREYSPSVGQPGKDVIWVPTPDELVRRMLKMAEVTDRDFVIDLGAGDGKIAIAAAKAPFHASSKGIEYNPDLARLANCLAQVEGVGGKTRIIQGDIFKEDFSRADVLTMYLLPELNLCVRHRILAMKPGTRVTSHQFNMGEWEADETARVSTRTAYLWIVPARVGGTWSFRDADGAMFNLSLTQSFQELVGDVTQGGKTQPLVEVSLRGRDLRFSFNDEQGVLRRFTGSVEAGQAEGVLSSSGAPDVNVVGRLQGQPIAGAWTEKLPECARYYGKSSPEAVSGSPSTGPLSRLSAD